jgi:hypothetical protein
MPLDERMSHYAYKIYSELPNEIKEITFSMPMFMEYTIITRVAQNWKHALFKALAGAERKYSEAGDGDLVIFGNMPSDFHFDAVFNFQDDKLQLPHEDNFLARVREEEVASKSISAARLENMHGASESKFQLTNCKATAGFLSEYIKTDPKIEDIKEKYKDKLKFKEDDKNGTSVQSPSKKRKL